jgi:hypothetical protein
MDCANLKILPAQAEPVNRFIVLSYLPNVFLFGHKETTEFVMLRFDNESLFEEERGGLVSLVTTAWTTGVRFPEEEIM